MIRKRNFKLAKKCSTLIMLITMIMQVLITGLSGVVAQAQTLPDSLNFVDEANVPITQLSMKKDETRIVGLYSTDPEDISVQVNLGGLILDQVQTNQLNTSNAVSVAYSEEASNAIVSWSSQSATVTTETNTAEASVEPIIPEPVNRLVWFVVTANEAGTYTIQASSTKNASAPLSVTVEEEETVESNSIEDSSNVETENQPLNEQDTQTVVPSLEQAITPFAASDYTVDVTASVLVDGNWVPNAEITNYLQYRDGIKYTVTIDVLNAINSDRLGIEIPNVGWGDWGTAGAVLTYPDGTTESLEITDADGVLHGLKDLQVGQYKIEFIRNFYGTDELTSAGFAQWYHEGYNYFPQIVEVYTIPGMNPLFSGSVETKAVLPRPVELSFYDSKDVGSVIENVKFVVKDSTGSILGTYTSSSDPVLVHAPVGSYIEVIEVEGYEVSGSTDLRLDIIGNSYNPVYDPTQRRIPLQRINTIETKLRFSEYENYFDEIVTSFQTIEYSEGLKPISFEFYTSSPTGKFAEIVEGSYVVIYRLSESGEKTEVREVPISNVWTGDSINGYTLSYVYQLDEELQIGEKVVMETQWKLPNPNVATGGSSYNYDYTVAARAADIDGNPSNDDSTNDNIRAYSKPASILVKEKQVLNEDGTKDINLTELQVGQKIRYRIVIQATGDESAQIKINNFEDVLPDGLKADDSSQIKLYKNGTAINFLRFQVANNKVTYNPDQVLYVAKDNPSAAVLTIDIVVEVGTTAVGKLSNTASVIPSVKEEPKNPNSAWKANEPIYTNTVTNYVKPTVQLKKSANPTEVFPGEVITYTIRGNLDEGSGAMHHGVLTDTLPEGITATGSTTYLTIYDANGTATAGSPHILSDAEVWTDQKNLEVDLTKYELNPMTLGMTFELTYQATADASVAGMKGLKNIAHVTGSDTTDSEEYRTNYPADADVEVAYNPGKLAVVKDVLKEATSINGQTVSVDDTISYQLIVSNTEAIGSMVKDAILTDTVPDGLTIIPGTFKVEDVSVADPTIDGQTITMNLGDIAGEKSVTVTFDVKVTAEASGTLKNVAKATGIINVTPSKTTTDKTEEVSAKNSILPKPAIQKYVAEEGTKTTQAFKGQTVPYVLIVTNESNYATVIDGKVEDKLPEGLEYTGIISISKNGVPVENPMVTFSSDKRSFTYEGFALEGGSNLRIVYSVNVTTDEIATVENTATLSGSYTDQGIMQSIADLPDVTLTDKATVTTVRGPGELVLEKSVSNVPEEGETAVDLNNKLVDENQIIEYRLIVSNKDETDSSRPTEIRDIVVTDDLEVGLEYQEGTLTFDKSDVTGSFEGNKLTVNVGKLQENETVTISFKVKVTAEALAKTPNFATAIGKVPTDPNNPSSTAPTDEVETDPVVIYKKPEPKIVKNVLDSQGNVEENKQVAINNTFTYQLIVTNGENAETTGPLMNSVVTDTLPAGLEYVAGTTRVSDVLISDEATWNGDSFTYQLPDTLEGGAKIIITFEVKVLYATSEKELGEITNTAYLNGEDTEGSKYDPKDSAVIEVVEGAGKLAISKAVTTINNKADLNEKVVEDNQTIRYTLVVKNIETAPSSVKNITIEDKLPKGLEYQLGSLTVGGADADDSAISGDSVTGQKLTLKLDQTLKQQESISISFDVKVTSEAEATIVNSATTSGQGVKNPETGLEDIEDVDPSNNVTVYKKPKPAIKKTVVSPANRIVAKGNTVRYRLVVTNGDKTSGVLMNGKVTDTLDTGLKHVAGTTTVNGEIVDESNWSDESLTISLPSPMKGGAEPVTIEFDVVVETNDLGEIPNVAIVTGQDKDLTEVEPVKDNVDITVKPIPGKLDIIKTVSKSNTDIQDKVVQIGDIITYTLVVTNTVTDPSLVSDVIITDDVPTGLIYVPGTLKLNSEELPDSHITGQHLEVNAGTLVQEETATISFDVKVTAEATGAVTNVAFANGTVETIDGVKSSLNEVKDKVDNYKAPNPMIEKTVVSPESTIVVKGDTVRYRLVVTNGDKTSGVLMNGQVTDTLPTGVKHVPNTTTVAGVTVEESNWVEETLTINLPESMEGGADSVIIEFDALVETNELGKITNVAKVNGQDRDLTEITPVEDNADITVKPIPGKLDIVKTVNKAGTDIQDKIVQVGDIITYTLVVTNTVTNPSLVSEVTITDEIPTGLIYQSGSLKLNSVSLPDSHVTGQFLEVNAGDLIQEKTATVSFDVEVTAAAKGAVTNVAYANGTVETIDGVKSVLDKVTDDAVNHKEPNPTIEKTAILNEQSNNKVVKGQTFTYQLIVKNGTDDTTGILYAGQVTDELPTGLVYQAETTKVNGQTISDAEAGWNNNILTYKLPTEFEGGEQLTITFDVKVVSDELNDIVNTAKISGTDYDKRSHENSGSKTVTTVRGAGELKISKQVTSTEDVDRNQDIVQTGEIIRYTLIVENSSTDPTEIKDVLVTDIIPNGLIYQAGTLTLDDAAVENDSDRIVGQNLSMEIGTLTEGQKRIIAFDVLVTDEIADVTVNTGYAEGNVTTIPGDGETPVEPVPSNDVEVYKGPNPVLTKSIVDPVSKTAIKNDIITYRLVVTNDTETNQSFYKGLITDALPAELIYQAGTTTLDGQSISDELAWTDSTVFSYMLEKEIAPNESVTIEFKVKVETNTLGKIPNTAVVSGEDAKGNTGYNSTDDEVLTIIPRPGTIAIDKNVYDKAGTTSLENRIIDNEEIITYEIIVTNTEVEPSEITNTIMTDDLPKGLIYQAGSLEIVGEGSVADSAVVGQKMTVNLGTLLSGESRTIRFQVKVTDDSEGSVLNVAYASGEVVEAANPTNVKSLDKVQDEVTVLKDPELAIQKSVVSPADATQLVTGQEIKYRLVVTNGDETVGDVKNGVVTDTLPTGLSYKVNSTVVNGQKVADDGIWKENALSYPMPTLFKGGSTLTIEFVVLVEVTQKGRITNTAQADGTKETGEPVGPVTDTADITVIDSANPTIEKSVKKKEDTFFTREANKVVTTVGEKINYQLVVTNGKAGETRGVLSDVKIVDALPEGLSYVANTTTIATASGVTSISDVGAWSNNVLTYVHPTLAGGEQLTVQFEVEVTAVNNSNSIQNIASLEAIDPTGKTLTSTSDVVIQTTGVTLPATSTPVVASPIQAPTSTTQSRLPNTGELQQRLVTIVGFILLSSLSAIYVLKRKQEMV